MTRTFPAEDAEVSRSDAKPVHPNRVAAARTESNVNFSPLRIMTVSPNPYYIPTILMVECAL